VESGTATLANYRRAAQLSIRLRPLLEIASGFGGGLLGVASMLPTGGWRSVTQRELVWLLVAVPLLHCAAVALWQLAAEPILRRQARQLLAEGETLLLIVGHEPAVDAQRAAREPHLRTTPHGERGSAFAERIAAAIRNWQHLAHAGGVEPVPAGLRWLPPAYGAGWAVLGLLLMHRFGFWPLLPPILFLVMWFNSAGLQAALGRDCFTLELASALAAAEDVDPSRRS